MVTKLASAVLMRLKVALGKVVTVEVVSASRVWALARLQERRCQTDVDVDVDVDVDDDGDVPGSAGCPGLLCVETEQSRLVLVVLVAVEVESSSEEPDQLEGSVLVMAPALVLVESVERAVLLMSNSVKVTMGGVAAY